MWRCKKALEWKPAYDKIACISEVFEYLVCHDYIYC